MTAPIEQRHAATMLEMADVIDHALNGRGPRRTVFALLVADVGHSEGARMNYVSTAHRADMLSMMREFIARHEGAVGGPGGRA